MQSSMSQAYAAPSSVPNTSTEKSHHVAPTAATAGAGTPFTTQANHTAGTPYPQADTTTGTTTAAGTTPASNRPTTASTYANEKSVATTPAVTQRRFGASDIILFILAIFVPPLAVFFDRGFKVDFWINILLTILAWFPGIIHAWYVLYRHPTGRD
ncbi:unnamed protein product [Sordaria macrospora k-hell]|uniref:WGS project CABT00000000 data, contig 2.152 n=1 Tax=Sordaria macrospora (strain ATCC MYA-333 / DSM 997 / K(L3346) / K-hell) TaxID=771870 RepID=F7WCK6_SORMK|nr:uncharacterized protein SMAC_09690 [Sordaria macrospora k-hell]CCC05643.1 unnamed protein product [Sordaria macrospora k-hell]